MQTKRVRYTYNREGYFYFSRRVPDDLLQHYDCRRIVQSLRTKQPILREMHARFCLAVAGSVAAVGAQSQQNEARQKAGPRKQRKISLR